MAGSHVSFQDFDAKVEDVRRVRGKTLYRRTVFALPPEKFEKLVISASQREPASVVLETFRCITDSVNSFTSEQRPARITEGERSSTAFESISGSRSFPFSIYLYNQQCLVNKRGQP